MFTKDTLKVSEFCSLTLFLADEWQDGKTLDPSQVELVVWGANHSVQLRDWLMGELPTKFDSAGMAVAFFSELISVTDDANRVPLTTILGVWLYACDEKQLSSLEIESALKVNPDYSLALLIKRVLNAGWPAEGIQTMFEELHPKVQEHLAENSEMLVLEFC